MRTRSLITVLSTVQQQQVPPTFVEPFDRVEPIDNPAPPVVTMADNRTMAQLLEAPTEGYEDAIVVPEITADNFELKHGLLTLVQNKQFFGHDKEDPHAHIRYFNKLTSTMKLPDKNVLEIAYSIFEEQIQKFVIHETKWLLPMLVRAILPVFLPRCCRRKIVVKAYVLDKKNQSQALATVKAVEENCVTCGGDHSYRNCTATDGNVYRDNIQEYASQAAAVNYNQGNTGYRPPMVANQIRPLDFPPVQQNQGNNQNRYNQNRGNNYNQGPIYQPPVNQALIYQPPINQPLAPQTQGVPKDDFQNYVKANDAVMRNMQNQNQNLQNQMTKLTDMLTKFVNSNTASTSVSGTLPSNTITNPKEDLKGITTRSGVAYQGPTIPTTSSSS
ncbi:hypothetical protein Tco_0768774 [Tanacetum coccineum]